MAEEKTRARLIDEARWRDEVGLPFPVHGAKKYKVDKRAPKDTNDRFADVEIGSGTRLVIPVYEWKSYRPNGLIGYVCGVVVDVLETETYTHWGYDTSFVVEIIDVSQPKLDWMRGRLKVTRSLYYNRGFVAVGKENWTKYKLEHKV